MMPKSVATNTASVLPLNTKYMAYPPDSVANKAVKNMVAPMPTYLLCSIGYLFSVLTCAPEQNQKKLVTFFITSNYIKLFIKRLHPAIVTKLCLPLWCIFNR